MTDSKIRAILSGLKGEIRRETDERRRAHLADMGCYWNSQLLSHSKLEFHEYEKGYNIDVRTCSQCGEQKDISNFRFQKVKQSLYLGKKCGACEDQNRKKNLFIRLAKKKANSYI